MYRPRLSGHSKLSPAGVTVRWNRKSAKCSKLTSPSGVQLWIKSRPLGAIKPVAPLPVKSMPGSPPGARESRRRYERGAYLLLATEQYVDEARTFLTALDEAQAPAHWEAELGNVLWMAARKNLLTI